MKPSKPPRGGLYSVGDTYNSLRISGFVRPESGRVMAECVCVCGSVKTYEPYAVRSGSVKSCGCKRESAARRLTDRELADEILANCAPANERGCRLWLGHVNNHGYGKKWNGDRKVYAHRAVAQGYSGQCDGRVVMHLCDTPRCCEPSHLVISSQPENLAEVRNKGRGGAGERYSDSDVMRVVEMYSAGSTQAQIAAKFGMTKSNVSAILCGRSRTSVTGIKRRSVGAGKYVRRK